MRRSAPLLAALLLALSADPVRAQCAGDLNGNGVVAIDELLTMVRAALYGCPLPGAVLSCPGDVNSDGMVTIDEILRAVNAALNGCQPQTATPPPSTATPTPPPSTATPTPPPSTATPSPPPSTATPSPLPSTATPSPLPSTASPSSLPSTASPSSLPSTATPSSLPSTATPSSLPSTATPSSLPSTATPSSLPSTATPSSLPSTATPTPLSSTATPTPTATEWTAPTPSATATASPTAASPTCPYTFLDNTLGGSVSCDYFGPFNSDPSCPTDLEALFAGDGNQLGVGVGTDPIVTFVATVTSATSASLVAYAIGDDPTLSDVSGTVELQQDGRVLVIAPNTSPFDIDNDQCAFVRYVGAYEGVLSETAAPAVQPAHLAASLEPVSLRLP